MKTVLTSERNCQQEILTFMQQPNLKDILRELAALKFVRVTGSYSSGEENINSDIDFWVKEGQPDEQKKNVNIWKVIDILNRFNIKWTSHMTGYIHTTSYPIQMEFAYYFRHRENRLPEVEIENVKFKTW